MQDSATEKIGLPLPTPPEKYINMLPKVSAYACFYLRDQTNRPFQVRSCYTTRRWQFVGGNMDPGEDPWQTAVREAEEETGLTRFREIPQELLMVQYRHPTPEWPQAKIGFVFDGGRLTDDELEQIKLDPHEHECWSVFGWDQWREIMTPSGYETLCAVEAARTGEGSRLLVRHGEER
ncbi:NUDIX domain-containing protein [Rhodococcus qingshengii]|uniref:NUDIX domain-containing protein n=1 Tax=Rhodococcus qingshengii TaxID=334542 RepID=UPI0035DCE150